MVMRKILGKRQRRVREGDRDHGREEERREEEEEGREEGGGVGKGRKRTQLQPRVHPLPAVVRAERLGELHRLVDAKLAPGGEQLAPVSVGGEEHLDGVGVGVDGVGVGWVERAQAGDGDACGSKVADESRGGDDAGGGDGGVLEEVARLLDGDSEVPNGRRAASKRVEDDEL
eukprot:739240-Hanusia_phi.AAC.2